MSERLDDAHTDTAPGPPLGLASLNGPFPARPLLIERYQDEHNFAKSVQRFIKNVDSTHSP